MDVEEYDWIVMLGQLSIIGFGYSLTVNIIDYWLLQYNITTDMN